VDGFRRSPPTELLGAAVVVLGGLGLVLFLSAPGLGGAGLSLHRAAMRALAKTPRTPRRKIRSRDVLHAVARSVFARVVPEVYGKSDDASERRPLALVLAPLLVALAASASLVALPLGRYLVAPEADVALLLVVATTALVTAGWLSGRSFAGGASAAAQLVVHQIPAFAATAGVVLWTGTLRIEDVVRAQGGWPWDWGAFRSPPALVLFALWLVAMSLVTHADGGVASVSSGDIEVKRQTGKLWPAGLAAASAGHRVVMAVLVTTLLLGGWRLPGISPAEQESRVPWQLAGSVVALAKTWGLLLVVAAARWVMPAMRMREATRLVLTRLAPLSLLAVAGAWGWLVWSPSRALELLAGAALVALLFVALLAAARRLRYALETPGADAHASPFL
jgi:NADH-quinone oxidoreductase subunit H